MPRGGARPNSGPKPGTATKKTRAIADQAAASGLTPLEYFLAVLRDPEAGEARRMDAAKAAAPFMHPRLTPSEDSREQDEAIPLAERLKYYARQDAIKASAGKVVAALVNDPQPTSASRV